MALQVPPHVVQPDRVVISGAAKYDCEVLASHVAADCVFISASTGLPPEAQAFARRKAATISLPAGNRAIGAHFSVSMPVTVVR